MLEQALSGWLEQYLMGRGLYSWRTSSDQGVVINSRGPQDDHMVRVVLEVREGRLVLLLARLHYPRYSTRINNVFAGSSHELCDPRLWEWIIQRLGYYLQA